MEPLTGIIQNYAWGSVDAIANLRGVPPGDRPEAEMWFGAHDQVSSTLPDRGGRTLRSVIEADPAGQLGVESRDRFGERLPYLLKILAAAEPLSIQAHPDPRQAVAGFTREDAEGVSRSAPTRCYRDRSHKPELIVALSDFEALVGFRSPTVIAAFLRSLCVPSLAPLVRLLERDDLASALRWALEEADGDVVDAAVAACSTIDHRAAEPHAELLPRLAGVHPGDRGLLVAAMLHRVVLTPGEALFLGAGTLHAYVDGLGVEVMANSDNVLRGGLTPKHVDVAELLAITNAEPMPPEVLEPADDVTTYAPPIGEFRLTRLVDPDHHARRPLGPEIALVTSGSTRFTGETGPIELGPGEALWVPASSGAYSVDGTGLVFVVEVGAVHSGPG